MKVFDGRLRRAAHNLINPKPKKGMRGSGLKMKQCATKERKIFNPNWYFRVCTLFKLSRVSNCEWYLFVIFDDRCNVYAQHEVVKFHFKCG